jgi:Cytochrome c oxidase subunit IV
VTDDAALLLRVSVFGLVAGAVYWFLSYEWLGTVALLLLGVGPGFAGLFIVRHNRSADQRQDRQEMLRRFAGMPHGDPPGPKSLEGQDIAVIPLPSLWPFTSSLGITVALSGLIFGLWLVILGLAMALYSGWGWIAAIMSETRYSHIRPTDEVREEGFASDRERDEATGRPR